MTTIDHSDCAVCLFWLARLAEERERALAGCEGAFDAEKHVRAELQEHLKQSAESEVSA